MDPPQLSSTCARGCKWRDLQEQTSYHAYMYDPLSVARRAASRHMAIWKTEGSVPRQAVSSGLISALDDTEYHLFCIIRPAVAATVNNINVRIFRICACFEAAYN